MMIHWFRQDLRLQDNPAFNYAASQEKVFPIYIFNPDPKNIRAMGAASQCWLHDSLENLNHSLNGKLSCYRGDPEVILSTLIKKHQITGIVWNRCYEPENIQQDKAIQAFSEAANIEIKSFNGALLWEPGEIVKTDGEFYKVFTPFYQASLTSTRRPRIPLNRPSKVDCFHDSESLKIADLELLPKIPWHQKIKKYWEMSEKKAHEILAHFLKTGIQNYQEGRNFPAQAHVSHLSPYLHFGQISPNQIWYALRSKEKNDDIDFFGRELIWREFAYHLLYQHPDLSKKNLQSKFDRFPWQNNLEKLKAWQKGETGYPIVDAGMRELWETGYMHNRVRMIVASFLVKNLLIDWRLGEEWFWECLVDADLANNAMNWQWVAGCGADAAPYFRIFNPITQAQKFDPEGEYIRRFIPELKNLPNNYLFDPAKAPPIVLANAKVIIGENYPKPIVDLARSRREALEIFSAL